MAKREFDIVIWGATGFTGQLVVEYLARTYGVDGELRWAIAGRNQAKLEEVRSSSVIAAKRAELPIIIADSGDPDSLQAMVTQTRVLCSTVGPYAKFGTPLIAAFIPGASPPEVSTPIFLILPISTDC